MKRFIIIFYITVCSLGRHFLPLPSIVNAQENLGDSIDCTDVSVNYFDDPTLTREERLSLMDKAFFDSLNKFELCQSARKMAESSSGARGGAAGESGDATGEPGGELAGKSVASSTLSGTENPKAMPPSENTEARESGRTNNGNMKSTNGKLPDDIPPAGNDDTLAAQIRYAAENETDPVKKEKLWNEYRKYKGLAPKK